MVRTNDSGGRADVSMSLSLGALNISAANQVVNYSVTVADGSTTLGGWAYALGDLVATVDGSQVINVQNQSYDFGSGVVSSPYFPRTISGSITVSNNGSGRTVSASATFNGDISTVGTATATTSIALSTYGPPSAPGTPTATASSTVEGRVSLSWSAPSNNGGSTITGYKIYRASNNALLATTSGTGTSTNLSLTVGTTLAFYVKAMNAIGDSASSGTSNSVLVNGNPTTPPTFTSLTNSGTTAAGTLIATWTAAPATPTAITGYTLELSSDNSNWLTWADVSAATLTTTLASIAPNSLRYVRVRARNAFSDANSSYSAASATRSATSSGPPSAPQNFAASTVGIFNGINLSWIAPLSLGNPSGISSYTISWTSTSGNGTETVSGSTTSLSVTNIVPGVTYNFSITAKNSLSTGGNSVAATTSGVPLPDPSWIDSTISTDFVVGKFYSEQVVRSQGAPITYSSSGTLPPGITFAEQLIGGQEVGVLSGTPTAQGKYTFTLTSLAASVQLDLTFTIYVRPSSRKRTSTTYEQTTIFKRFDGTQWIDVGTVDVSGSPVGCRRFDGTSWVQTTLPTL